MGQEIATIELFRSISGYLNYQVSSLGRVMDTDTGEILEQSIDVNGNPTVVLIYSGKRKVHEVPMLAVDTFGRGYPLNLLKFKQIDPVVWLPIEGYDNYLVSSGGEVVDMYTGERMHQRPYWGGNNCVALRKNGRNRNLEVHMLIARAFTRVYPNYVIYRGADVDHSRPHEDTLGIQTLYRLKFPLSEDLL